MFWYIIKIHYAGSLALSSADHHECNTNSDNCDQHCHNTHGSFYCSCEAGWRLDPNGYTCNGMCMHVHIDSIMSVVYNYSSCIHRY